MHGAQQFLQAGQLARQLPAVLQRRSHRLEQVAGALDQQARGMDVHHLGLLAESGKIRAQLRRQRRQLLGGHGGETHGAGFHRHGQAAAQQRAEGGEFHRHRAADRGVGAALTVLELAPQPLVAGALVRPQRRALPLQPIQLHLAVARRTGAAHQLLQALAQLLGQGIRHPGTVGALDGAEAPHRDAEIVQGLGVLADGEPLCGGFGVADLAQQQLARRALGRQLVQRRLVGAVGVGARINHWRSRSQPSCGGC